MKLFYYPHTCSDVIIHPSELLPGEIGIIECWFSKDSDLTGQYILNDAYDGEEVEDYYKVSPNKENLFIPFARKLVWKQFCTTPHNLYRVRVYR
jgi:hypothetical protein